MILPLTRIVAVLVLPFLVLAFLILYVSPESSGERFAWAIKPNLQAAYVGAGYLGGFWLFLKVALGGRWSTVYVGFPAVTVFTLNMLVCTILYWGRFDLGHFPFQLWLGLYVVTPLLIPWLAWRQRELHDRRLAPADLIVPTFLRQIVGIAGVAILAASLWGFLQPAVMQAAWPWALSPLTARLMTGWGMLLGLGNLVVAFGRRWSAWKTGVESIAIWHILVLVATIRYRADMPGGWLNWYTATLLITLGAVGALYLKAVAKTSRTI